MTTKQVQSALMRRGWSSSRSQIFIQTLTEEQQQQLADADDDRQRWQEAMDAIADAHENKA